MQDLKNSACFASEFYKSASAQARVYLKTITANVKPHPRGSEHQFGADLGDLRRENVTAAFGHDDALLPADAERRAGDERVGLIGHVGLERVHGGRLGPRGFDLDDAGGVQRAVDEVVLEAVVHEVLIELLGNVASHHAGLDLLARPLVRLTAELNDVAALALELTEADRVANGGGIAVDLGRKVQLDNVALLELAVTRTGDGVAGMPVTRRRR